MEKKNMWGKLNLDYQPVQYKKNLPKIILEKKHRGKYRSKIKIMWGNIVTTNNILKKKTTKQNRQRPFWKKKEEKNS